MQRAFRVDHEYEAEHRNHGAAAPEPSIGKRTLTGKLTAPKTGDRFQAAIRPEKSEGGLEEWPSAGYAKRARTILHGVPQATIKKRERLAQEKAAEQHAAAVRLDRERQGWPPEATAPLRGARMLEHTRSNGRIHVGVSLGGMHGAREGWSARVRVSS
ncbi:MAG: hypothetical protein KF773_20955 [Deltaproteobacteria bacterium]|nr:hypothetical protein [Deltaproteobacteria bacterium]